MEKLTLESALNNYSKKVSIAALQILDSFSSNKFKKVIDYQISTGGKKLRPVLAVLSCELLGGRLKDVLYPAAGLDILHNYSLIIDDIVDKSRTRRGMPTTWAKYGSSIAQCAGIHYFASVFETAHHSKHPAEISELFIKTAKISTEGEILDLLFDQKDKRREFYLNSHRYERINKKQYLAMIKEKTAALVQACCEVGAVCADAKSKHYQVLSQFGIDIGIAGQIKDDILDVFGEEKKFGKKIGHDIAMGKLGNIVIVFALEELRGKKREKLLNILREKDPLQGQIKQASNLIGQTKAQARAYQLGRTFVKKAKKQLALLPQNKWNNLLSDFADFMLEREK